VLAYILHDGQEQHIDVCAYSLRYHTPTVTIKTINITTLGLSPEKQKYTPLLLTQPQDWFLCCHASLLFLEDVQNLLEFTHPLKMALKISRYQLFDSPLQLWNGSITTQLNADTINLTDDINIVSSIIGIGEIPDIWVHSPDCAYPRTIPFDNIDGKYTDIWAGYYEAAQECSKSQNP
jgi:hypothetical protein